MRAESADEESAGLDTSSLFGFCVCWGTGRLEDSLPHNERLRSRPFNGSSSTTLFSFYAVPSSTNWEIRLPIKWYAPGTL